MRVLVVATNATRQQLSEEVRAGVHQRVDYLELAERFGTHHVDYNRLKPNRPLQQLEGLCRMDMRQAAYVARMARQGRYDLVLSLSERVGIPLALLLDRRIGHLVIFHHGMSPPKLRLIKMLKLHSRWDAMIAISEAEARGMQAALGLPGERIVTLHTPVDTAFYRPATDQQRADQPFVQSLGLSYRDYPTLIRAMRRLPAIPCQLRVGSSWVEHRGGHEREQLPTNVSLQPFVHPSVLRDCYAASRFIIVPIRAATQWSAGCTSVQAAQAMGKPVIATRMPGLSEYLVEGETGMLVAPGDDRAMAEAIGTLWDNPDQVVRMGRQARAWIESNHSLERWLKRIEGLAERAVSCATRAATVASILLASTANLS